jgi:glutaminyl-peptide cyclotransferase
MMAARPRWFSCLPAGCLFALSLWTGGCGAEPQRNATQAAGPSSSSPAPGRADAGPPPETTGGFDGGKAYAHVERLVAIGPRSPGSEGIRRAQEYIHGQLGSFGCPVEEDDFHASTPIGSVPMKNIVVKIPGASPKIVLFTTHYDTKRMENFVGANDGGSSTGVMLELARLLCGRKHALTVWIAFFDGEEAFVQWGPTDGTFGSRQMAAKLAVSGDLKRVKAMLLADLVGDRSLKIKRESNSTPWLTDLVWGTAARLGYESIFASEEVPIEDDHLPFVRRGVAAVDIIDLDEPYWHTSGDTLDKISPRSLAIVGHVLLEALAALEKKLG